MDQRAPARSPQTPARSQQSYRHEAFLWQDANEFMATLVRFVEDGLSAGEPVMAALIPEHIEWLREGLGSQAARVMFVDIEVLGRNPARIIPAWQHFLDLNQGQHRPARGVGEPIWVGRRDDEVLECQLHEALLNVAFDPTIPFWLVCPYDAQQLAPAVIEEAHRSHHAILEATSYRGSTTYGGRDHVNRLFSADLDPLPEEPVAITFLANQVHDVFACVLQHAYSANLWSDQAIDLADGARQLAADSVRRSAESVTVLLWERSTYLVCEVQDDTVLDDVLAGRRAVPQRHEHGLWRANRTCDLVQLRSSERGTRVRLHVRT